MIIFSVVILVISTLGNNDRNYHSAKNEDNENGDNNNVNNDSITDNNNNSNNNNGYENKCYDNFNNHENETGNIDKDNELKLI